MKKAFASVAVGVCIVAFVLSNNTAYAQEVELKKSEDKTTWIKIEANPAIDIPIAILYEDEKLELLDDNYIRMYGDSQIVDFMIDDFSDTPHKAWDNALYTNGNMSSSKYIYNYKSEQKNIEDKKVLICSFQREQLKYAPNLNTHFVYIDIEVDNKILVSVYFKSNKSLDIEQCMSKIMDSNIYQNYFSLIKEQEEKKSEEEKDNTHKKKKKKKTNEADLEKKIDQPENIKFATLEDGLYYQTLSGDVTKTAIAQESFYSIPIDENINIDIKKTYVRTKRAIFHDLTKEFYRKEFAGEDSNFKWGIFEPMSNVSFRLLKQIEKKSSMKFDILLEYYHMNILPTSKHISDIYRNGQIPEFTFQTSIIGDFQKDMIYDILSGEKDEQIHKLLDIIKDSDVPILFRLNNEMNGDWCNYNALYYHKDPEVFVEFWRWMRIECEKNNVNNIIWVWNPNWGDFPNSKWNNYMRYFPGVPYVDIIGLTGYNTGTYYQYEDWRTFSEIYDPMIEEYNLHFKNYPYLITEFGCADVGGDKAEWIRDALIKIKALPIKGAVWWNGVDRDPSNGNVARKYRFDDEPEILSVFKEYMEEELK